MGILERQSEQIGKFVTSLWQPRQNQGNSVSKKKNQSF
jgi:hypothetical protein